MLAFLAGEEESMEAVRQAIEWTNARRRNPSVAKTGSREEINHLRESGVWFEHSEVRLAAPIPNPPHLLAVALNYRSHSAEINIQLPQYPNVFTKEGKVIGTGESIEIPKSVREPDYEAELAVVIGKRARAVPKEVAYDYVAGYMTFNDVTSRDYQFQVSQYTLGKSPDTFSAMGPFLVLKDEIPDPHRLRITTRIGQELLQDSNTSYMIFPIADLIAYMSQLMTLEPGTVIATGTPSGVGHARKPPRYLKPGDTIIVEVEGLGVLENRVVRQNSH
jgi:2-keto-4-pentenoate hydratase/2-oxohepta-3-ene-1,7-dioic acid hydratase in catechol pathway